MKTVLAILLMCGPAFAQHSVTLSWTPGAGSTDTKIYKNGSLLTTTPNSGSVYTDTTVTAGSIYTYYATAFNSTTGRESVPSSSVTAVIPGGTPLNIFLTQAYQSSAGKDYLLIEWSDTPGGTTAYVVFGANGKVIRQGNSSSAVGYYKVSVTIPAQTGSVYVCDASKCMSKTF